MTSRKDAPLRPGDGGPARLPKPRLTLEYRMFVTFTNDGVVSAFHYETREEAEDAALRLVRRRSKNTWKLEYRRVMTLSIRVVSRYGSTWAEEKRLLGEWMAMPTPVAVQFAMPGDGAQNGHVEGAPVIRFGSSDRSANVGERPARPDSLSSTGRL